MTPFCLVKRIRDRFVFWRHADDPRHIAAKVAHQCLGEIVRRIGADGESWSDAQIRGYLRAIAAPRIDVALEERGRNRLSAGLTEQARATALELLEQFVVQKVNYEPAIVLRKSAAA
jgi:hypothetical protein